MNKNNHTHKTIKLKKTNNLSDIFSIKTTGKILSLLILMVVLIAITSKIAKAEDEKNEKESESHEQESSSSDDNEWDMSNDFSDTAVVTDTVTKDVPVAEVEPTISYVLETTIDNGTVNSSNNLTRRNITEADLNLTDYMDDDNDTILNKYDQYPGQDDRAIIDSDGDGVVDKFDKYMGYNDSDYEDVDNDGVIDSQDSDITKNTDKDHDGIDDAYDTQDGRSFFVKVFSFIGLIKR